MKIKLAENFRAVFYAPFYATHALGLFKREGIEIELIDSPSPGSGIADMLAGRIDVVWGGPLRVIKQRDQEADSDNALVAFCEVVGKDPFFLVGASREKEFHLSDLVGKKFGVVTEVPTPWLCLQQDLRDVGVSIDSLQVNSDRTMGQNLEALAAGTIDYAQYFEPFVSQTLANGVGVVLHAANSRGPTAYTTFISTRKIIAQKKASFEAMIRAVEQMGPWIDTHTGQELAALVAPFYPHVAHDVLIQSMDRYKKAGLWFCKKTISRRGFERLKLSMRRGGFIESDPSYENCIAEFSQEVS
jgi:NitT/TauT family transport system substrate-binding protein